MEPNVLMPAGADEREPASIVSVLNFVLAYRYVVCGIAMFVCVLVLGTLLALPRTFTAESSFMLQTRSNLPSNLSGLASQFGVALPLGDGGQSPAFYADLLTSRELLSAIVDSAITAGVNGRSRRATVADWLRVRETEPRLRREDAIRKLGKTIGVTTSAKTGVVAVRVTTRDADLSREINARMLEWLNDFNLQKRQSQASAERQFTESQLNEARARLGVAEDRQRLFAERNRATAGSPLLQLEAERLGREVSMRQQMYSALAQSLDRAKIDEVRDTPIVTVLLAPEAPVRPDSRGLVAKGILVGILGLVLGVLVASLREAAAPRERDGRSEIEELTALRARVGEDARAPIRTLGRLARLRMP